MKTIKIIVFLLLALPVVLQAEYPQNGWTTSIIDGIEQADKDNKYLFLYFGGTDWCSWCKKLDKEVFNTSIFQKWAKKNAVLVLLDFPANIKQPETTVLQNQILQNFFGVKGYPTVLMLDSNLFPLLKTGYRKGGADNYIKHLENDRNVKADAVKDFPEDFRKLLENSLDYSIKR